MPGPLSEDEIAAFGSDGFVRLTHAFSRSLADECCDLLWEQLSVERDIPASWQQSVIAVPPTTEAAFIESLTTPRLTATFDQLLGMEAWQRPTAVGPFVVRFPSLSDPGDTGWHADGRFERNAAEPNDGPSDRVLSLLCLYTDVVVADAPVRLVRGSHRAQAKPDEVAAANASDVLHAVGRAGDVYLCHPSLVHAASFPQRGNRPRVMSQQGIIAQGR
ncbi:MAG: phytanoyl-CoA dioxygenase family protein [Actinomycetota bacterium]|nr:phytanoyl-CoA dioxygenase family protein [Actinomycetota bacterium]